MDTPASTPETLPVPSSLESPPPAHPQPPPFFQPSPPLLPLSSQLRPTTMASDLSSLFSNSLRPLSPPDSPFGFGSAFSKPSQPQPQPHSQPPRAPPAPASPHFTLPVRAATTTTRKARAETLPAKFNAKASVCSAQDNPYFPSIAEQEQRARWKRDEARWPRAPPPLAPIEDSLETADSISNTSTAGNEQYTTSNRSTAGNEQYATPAPSSPSLLPSPLDAALSPVERKRAMSIKLPARRVEEFPASPESLPSSSSLEGGPPPVLSAEEYRRNIVGFVEGIIKRGKEGK